MHKEIAREGGRGISTATAHTYTHIVNVHMFNIAPLALMVKAFRVTYQNVTSTGTMLSFGVIIDSKC